MRTALILAAGIAVAAMVAATAAATTARPRPATTAGTWAIVDSPSFESNSIVLEVAFDKDGIVGYAGGGTATCPAHIQKSSDGGKTWNVVWPVGNCTSIDFNLFLSAAARDAKHAVVGGSFFQMYTDDGARFEGATNNFGSPPQDAGVIPGAQKKFALVSGKEARAGGNSIDVSDDGSKYTKIPIPDTAANSSNGFLARYGAFPSEETWYVTMGSFENEASAWSTEEEQQQHRVSKHLSVGQGASGAPAIRFSKQQVHASNGGGNVAAIVKTTDGGTTWSLVYKNDASTGNNNVYPNGIHCASVEHCVAVLEGDSARILVTRDGGKTWNETMKDMDPHSSLFAVRMLSVDEVWVAGGHPSGEFEGRFWHSLDGGDTWEKIAFPGTYIVSLDMMNASGVGYAVALTSQNPAGIKLFKYQAQNEKRETKTKISSWRLSTMSAVAGMHRLPGVGAFPKGVNETYGFPDGVGALIVEGPFPYKNGPPTWSEKTPWGAYGLITIPGTTKHANTTECTPIPSDSPFFGSKDVHPVALTNGANTMCMLGCDLEAVKNRGVDPCHVASVHGGPTNSIHSCFDVGPGFAGGSGVCGYNCSAFEPKSVGGRIQTCTAADMADGNCHIFCNSQGFPQ